MKYLLLMYPEDLARIASDETNKECVDLCEVLVGKLHAKGQYLGAGILEPASSGRTVQVRSGRRTTTDGPFIETREQFAGYLLIEADSFEEAIAIAAEHPVAFTGTVTVRPVKDVDFLTSNA